MPEFQVTCRELVYVDRTYEIEAADAQEARAMVEKAKGGDNCVDEQVQDSHSFCHVLHVCDADGIEAG